MTYRVKTLIFDEGKPIDLIPGQRVVAVLSSHEARADKWYVTVLVGLD